MKTFPITNWGRKAKFLFTHESLPDLNWQDLQTQITNKARSCTPVQYTRNGTKYHPCKLLPRKVLDVQDAGKQSD